MNKSALLVAAITALLGGFLLTVYLRRFEQEASGGAQVTVLVALKPVEAGSVLADDAIATRAIPIAYVENRAVRETEKAKVVGLRVSTAIQANQTIMWTDLALATDDRRDLSSLVQPGMRAVTIRATNDDKSFALIRPGDRVDVLATMAVGNAADALREPRSSVVLLQNVLVLSVGLDTGADQGSAPKAPRDQRDMLLSLSLNLPEAQLLSLAGEKGRLSVALRNPNDLRVTEGASDLNSGSLLDSKARTAVQDIRKTVTTSPTPAPAPTTGPVRLEPEGARP